MTSSNKVSRHKSSSTSNRSLASLTWLSDREEVGGRPTSRVSLPGALSFDRLVRGMSEFSDISSTDWLLPSIKEVLGSDSGVLEQGSISIGIEEMGTSSGTSSLVGDD